MSWDDGLVEPEDTATGPTCNRCGRPTNEPRTRSGRLCLICLDEDYQKRSAGYDAVRAAEMRQHPAKGKRRPFRLVSSYEFLGHQEEGL